MSGKKLCSESGNKEEKQLDESFDDVDIVRLLGLRKVKKSIRKHKRRLNERIRTMEVVQDESGNWVPATPEQKAEMKEAAKALDTRKHRPLKRSGKKVRGAGGLTAAFVVGPPLRPVSQRSNTASAVNSHRVRSSALAMSATSDTVGKAISDPIKLIIAGAPASGKGTQCEKIKAKYGVVHLSTGDMLRAAVADETPVGLMAKDYMDSGKLVPDEVIIGVVKDRLDAEDCKKNGWLLDGFPRTPGQAQALADAGVSADCFLFLNVPDDILVERVVGRRTDPETGKIYHMTFSPPEDEEVKARLVQRSDDTEEKVKVRLEQFHSNVDSVRGSYSDIIVDVDGNCSPDVVTDAITSAIAEKVTV